MEKEKTGRRYVKINVEPSEKGAEYSKIEIQAYNPQDFIITTLLSLKAMSKKFEVSYEELTKTFINALKNEEIMDSSITRLREEKEDTLL